MSARQAPTRGYVNAISVAVIDGSFIKTWGVAGARGFGFLTAEDRRFCRRAGDTQRRTGDIQRPIILPMPGRFIA